LPAGCEETELSIRVKQWMPEAILLHQPEARVRHQVPPIRGSLRYFLRRCLAEGRSKAQVTAMVGKSAGLESERAYVSRTIPIAIFRGLGRTLRGDVNGARQ